MKKVNGGEDFIFDSILYMRNVLFLYISILFFREVFPMYVFVTMMEG